MKFLIVSFALVAFAAAEVTRPVAILKQAHDTSPDGSYSYTFETENGIFLSENGTPGLVDAQDAPVVVVKGHYQYTSPDGTPVSLSYVADHNGYQPEGEHIPPVPLLIQRGLEYIRTHPPQPEHQ